MKQFSRVMDTDEMVSDSSGCESENDLVNKVYEMQKIYHQEI